MKILKINISNLNSIEEAEIDFTDELLSKEPLFLICGETGSGKTTILDAITLALYDKASRFETTDNKEKAIDGQAANSSTHILRRGAKDGFAKVFFKVQNEVYCATWQMHKTRNGTFDLASRRKLEVIRGGAYEECAVKVGEVNDKIVELVGLSYDQFMRSVMLAQNHFSTFLTSEKAKQTEILEMLTGTEIYSEIADKVRDGKNAAFAEQKNLTSKYEEVSASLKTEEEIQRLSQEKFENEKLLKEKDDSLSLLEKQLVWLADEQRLRQSFESSKKAFQDAVERQQADEITQNRSFLMDYQDTEDVRKKLTEKLRIKAETDSIEQKIEAARIEFANLSASRQKMLDILREMDLKKMNLEKYIETNRPHEAMFQKADIIAKNLNDASVALSMTLQYQNKTKQLSSDMSLLQKKVDDLLAGHQSIKETVEKAEENLLISQNDFQAAHYDELLKRKADLDLNLERHQRHKLNLEGINLQMERYWETETNLATLQTEIDTEKGNLETLKNSRNEAQADYDAKTSDYKKQQLIVDDVAKELRSRLIDGEPCPICGSVHHPFQNEVFSESLLQHFEKECTDAEKKLKEAQNAEYKCLAYIKAKTDRDVQEKQNLDAIKKKVLSLCKTEELPTKAILDTKLNQTSATIEALTAEKSEVSKAFDAAESLRKKCDECQKTCNDRKKQFDTSLQNLSAEQEKQQKLKSEIEKHFALSEEQHKFYDQCLSEVENILSEDFRLQDWKQNLQPFASNLLTLATEWKDKTASLADLITHISEMQKIEAACAYIYQNIIKRKPEWENVTANRDDIPSEKLSSSFAAFEVSLNEWLSAKESNASLMTQLDDEIQTFIDHFQRQISMQRLMDLNKVADVNAMREKLNQVDERVTSCSAVMKQQAENLKAHSGKEGRPSEEDSKDVLLERKNALIKEKENLLQTANELFAQLDMNAKVFERSKQLKTELDEKTRVFMLWNGLARALGTTNTDNFRDFAQSYTMRILLEQANVFMRQLSSRYLLCCEPDSLAIQVSDMDMGGEKRVTTSLSGGETFLVSLALALGLASLNTQGFNIDMLFIDEGFGTLDGESLDMAMSTLENLHSLGRKVGIISHVETLKERIPAQIQLIRKNKATSIVKVVKQ